MPDLIRMTDEEMFADTDDLPENNSVPTRGGLVRLSDDEMFAGEEEEPEALPYTGLEAGGMGLAQGATLDFADEIEGGVRALYDIATGPAELKDLLKTYQKRRDAARDRYKQAQADSPGAYMTGNIAGGVGSSFLPGGALLNATKGAKLAAMAGGGAKGLAKRVLAGPVSKGIQSGAVAGAGASEADLVEGDLEGFSEDVGSGAAYGGGTAGVFKGVGAAANLASPKWIAKKFGSVVLNTPEELSEKIIKHGKKNIMEAPTRGELGPEWEGIVNRLRDKTIYGSKEARDELEGSKFKSSEITGALKPLEKGLEKRSEGFKGADLERDAARGWVKKRAEPFAPVPSEPVPQMRGGIPNYGKMVPGKPIDKEISGSGLKDTIQSFEKATDWTSKTGEVTKIDKATVKRARGILDNLLKTKNPKYAKAMKNVAADTSLLTEALEILPSARSLPSIFRRMETDKWGAGQYPREIIKKVDENMGTDITHKIMLSYAKESLEKSVTQGSMNVNKFRGLMEKWPYVGPFAGLIGAVVDKYGRQITMGALDGAIYLHRIMKKKGVVDFKKSIKPFIDQAKKGNYSAAVALQMAEETYPEGFR